MAKLSYQIQHPKKDHKILNAAISLQEQYPDRMVVLVTKDINLRLKARALDLPSEDYLTGKIQDVKSLVVTGKENIEDVSFRHPITFSVVIKVIASMIGFLSIYLSFHPKLQRDP